MLPPMSPALRRSKVTDVGRSKVTDLGTDFTDRLADLVTERNRRTDRIPERNAQSTSSSTEGLTSDGKGQTVWQFLRSKVKNASPVTAQPTEFEKGANGWSFGGLFGKSKVVPSLIPEPITTAMKSKCDSERIDRSNAITFERLNSKNSVLQLPKSNLCGNCTCNLDPVSLSGHFDPSADSYRTQNIDFCLPNENPYVNMDPRIQDDRYLEKSGDLTRNKFNLRINPVPGLGHDPLYDVIAKSSPRLLAKFRELAFTYPPLPPRPSDPSNKEAKRRRILIALIVLLLVAIVVIVVTNVVVAHYLISRSAQPDNTTVSKPLQRIDFNGAHNQSHVSGDVSRTSVVNRTLVDVSKTDANNVPNELVSAHEDGAKTSISDLGDLRAITQSENLNWTRSTGAPSTFVTSNSKVTTSGREIASSTNAISITTQSSTVSTQRVKLITGNPILAISNSVTSKEPPAVTLARTRVASASRSTTKTPAASTSVTSRNTTTPKPHPTWLPEYDKDVECEPNQFKCRYGVSRLPCLYPWEKCDGIQDCSDGSDEEFCDVLECYGNFKCADGQCVSLAKVCNGLADCADSSDEKNCSSFQCKSYEYRCPSGYCIPTQWVCDGEADCPDHREEYNCSRQCSSDKFLCREGWCITKEWRCNGVSDCAGGEDEMGCECPTNHFKCENGGCTTMSQVCDGVQHCTDGSDEWQCVNLAEDGTLLVRRTLSGDFLPVCADTWNGNYSDLTCRQLGYSGSTFTGSMPFQADAVPEMFSVSQAFSSFGTASLQGLVERRSSSSCPTKVTIHCTTHECGSFSGPPSVTSGQRSPTQPKGSRAKRVVGGAISEDHDWPTVGILYHHVKKWACTATVLAPGWVVTSALCVRRTDPLPFDWKFVIGTVEPSKATNELSMRTVRSFLRHPSYKFQTQLADHDMMLVQLDHPLVIGQGIQAICLPDRPTPPGAWCMSAGWGYAMPGGFYINKALKHVQLQTWSPQECNGTRHYNGAITPRMICAAAADEGEGMCFNDEGSPLLCHDSETGKWSLTGVLTSQACGSHQSHPSVFADVFAMRRWIANSLGMVH